MILCIVSPFAPVIAKLLSFPVGLLIDFILITTEKISQVPFGLVYSENIIAATTLIIFFVLVFLIYYFPTVFKIRYCIPAISVIILAVTGYCLEDSKTDSKITFLPSGYGQTVTVSAGKALALIDCSGSGTRNSAEDVAEWMDWWGFDKIDLLILTAVDKTHARNVPELLKNVPVEKIIIPPNCRQNDFYNEVLDSAKIYGVPLNIHENLGEQQIGNPSMGISLIGGIDRKLAVRVKNQTNDVLIMHALTQKMQQDLLSEQKLKADTLVLSQSGLTDVEKLKDTLDIITPKTIIVESSFEFASKLFDIPVLNTFEAGEIQLKSKVLTYKEPQNAA